MWGRMVPGKARGFAYGHSAEYVTMGGRDGEVLLRYVVGGEQCAAVSKTATTTPSGTPSPAVEVSPGKLQRCFHPGWRLERCHRGGRYSRWNWS